MADYLVLSFYVILINVIPAFMPPTWIVLALAMINDATFDPLMLTMVGTISSTTGRMVLSIYSGYFRRFFTKKHHARANEIKEFFRKKDKELFFGTFAYALSPLPSNFIFLAKGLTRTDSIAIFPGFFVGRLVSYFVLIVLSNHLFVTVGSLTQDYDFVRMAFDLLGIAAAFSFLFIDWDCIIAPKAGGSGKKVRRKKAAV